MKRLFPGLLLIPFVAGAQPLTPELLTELPTLLNETSGALRLGDDMWISLDSDNSNTIYRVNQATGQILQEVLLSNATNVDWEDITTDGTWFYVGDIGNNAGARTDLAIHRFPLSELTASTTAVVVETITFHYADQSDFTPAYDDTNWDCEAMIAMDDSIFLFTKNWLDEHTHLYALPATPGDHVALRRAEFNTQGLVTGAAWEAGSGVIALLGHTEAGYAPFVWTLRDLDEHHFFDGISTHHPITVSPLQVEAIEFETPSSLIIGNEWSALNAPALWRLQLPMAVVDRNSTGNAVHTFPVPADKHVHVEDADLAHPASIFDLNGALLATVTVGYDGNIELPYLVAGEYLLEVWVRSQLCRIPLIIAH
ncbi:MAG: hypothetical protein JNM62_15920 [Flavobacteriales bacterium]|nr:hypothetical protein [Flavobacteriales bacterium]